MSGRIMGMALRTRLHPTTKLVLVAYAYHANDKDPVPLAWPSTETLMEMTGLSERAVRDQAKWLRDQQILIPAGTRNRSKCYRINLARLEQDPASYDQGDEKPAPGAGIEGEKPAADAGITPEKPAPGAGINEKPAPPAGFQDSNGREKPAAGAGISEKPARGAEKPARGAPKTIETIFIKQKEEEEEEPAAAAAPRGKGWILTEPEAERVFTDVTSMMTIPGGLDEKELAISAICNLAPRYGPELTEYLKPFWEAWIGAKTKQGRSYSRTRLEWLTSWAVAGEVPDYAKPKNGSSPAPSQQQPFSQTTADMAAQVFKKGDKK